MAPLRSNEPNKIRSTARPLSPSIWRVAFGPWRNDCGRSRTAGCPALTATGRVAAAPPSSVISSRRFTAGPSRAGPKDSTASVGVGDRCNAELRSGQCPSWVQTRSWGRVGSMSGLPESGHGWAIYEYTPTTPLAPRMGSCRLVPARSCVDEPIAVFRRFRITPHRGAEVAQRLWTTRYCRCAHGCGSGPDQQRPAWPRDRSRRRSHAAS